MLFYNLKNAINCCLNDLSVDSNLNKTYFESIMQLIPSRTNQYPKIEVMLKNEGVKDKDRTITLDGHEFACQSAFPVDFVTFDEECCYGAKNVGMLCFNSIRGKDDFKAS